MMQLFCNGYELDLYNDAGLQFKKSNPAYAMNELQAERTTQIKLPSTPNNDRALALARVPAFDGEGMRRKFSARLVDGLIVKDGFLYVSEFDGKDYSAILVAGLAYDLKAFDNYGWGSIIFPPIDPSDPTILWDTTRHSANEADLPAIGYVKYHASGNEGYEQPSIDLGKLFALMKAQGIFDITGYTSQQVRLIRNERNAIDRVKEILTNTPDQPDNLTLSTANGIFTLGNLGISGGALTSFHYEEPCSVTFAEDTPANLCICYAKQVGTGLVGFIGDRYFELSGGNIVYRGEPLAGRTIQLPTDINGQTVYDFVLMDAEGADFYGGVPYYANDGQSAHMDRVQAYNVSVRVTADVWFDNRSAMLMDLNLGDLLKAYAALTGKLINVKANGGVQFVDAADLDFMELDLIASKNVKRTFSDYARSNSVKYAKNDLIPEDQQGVAYYTIDNDNIEESKDLLTLKFDQGGLYGDGADSLIDVLGTTGYGRLKIEALALAGAHEYMQRTDLVLSTLLQGLCDVCTQVKVQARMSMLKYSQVDSATGFYINGLRYTWTEANWQKNVADLTLQRL